MSAVNPYDAPDAALDTGQDELYQPSIFSFSGRIGRMRYLAYGIGINFLLMAIIGFVSAMLGFAGGGLGSSSMGMMGMGLFGIFYLVAIVLSVMFAKRRLNDLNRSGWWFLLFIVPIVNLLMTIYLLFFPGTDGSNNFGPAPVANTLGVLILGWMLPVFFILGIAAAVLIPQFAGVAPVGQ